jgi:HSP20 family molecular chaperone IbpA
MTEISPASKRRYERPVVRSIGEREMFEVAGKPSSEPHNGQTADGSAFGYAQGNTQGYVQGWCWPGATGQYWPWGYWPGATPEAAAPEDQTDDAALRTPLYRMSEQDDCFLVFVEIPGADPDDIDLYVGRNDVVVTAPAPDGEAAGDGSAQSYYGALEFGEELDADKVETSYANGILQLKLYKSRSGARRHVKVSPAR